MTKKPKMVVIKNMADIKTTNIMRKVAVENKVGRPSFFVWEKWIIKSQNGRSKFFNKTAQFWSILPIIFVNHDISVWDKSIFSYDHPFSDFKFQCWPLLIQKDFLHSRPILTEYWPFSIQPPFNFEIILSQGRPSSRSYPLGIQNGNNYDVNGGQ